MRFSTRHRGWSLGLALGVGGAWAGALGPTSLAQTMRFVETAGRGDGLIERMGLARGDVAVLDLAGPIAPGRGITLRVPVNGSPVTLVLAPVSQRAEGFRVMVQGADGAWTRVEPGPVRTYEGVSPELPGSVVSAYLDETGVTARIETPGLPGAFWVEPAPAGAAEIDRGAFGPGIVHVGYHSLDRVIGGPRAGEAGLCASHDAAVRSRAEIEAPPEGQRSTCSAPVCVAELACDSDYELFERYGSVDGVRAQIERVVAVANLQFVGEVGVRHRITTILVRTAPGAPYTSFQATPLLLQMQAEWNASQAGVPRDVAVLFTGKTLSAGVLGSALTGSICDTSQAYAMVRPDCCGSLAGATDITAHELGHVWGASHCACSFPNPDSTMNASITFANSFVTDISGASVASIRAGRASAGCLEADAPVPPAGPFELLSPPTETAGLTGPVALSWGASANAAFYVVTVADNPAFAAPVLSLATLGPGATVPAAALAPATRYHWKVEAWNAGSAFTPASSGAWTFLTAVPPPACPGDFFADNTVNTVDLTFLLGRFGQLVDPGQNGDMNGDGRVNTIDLTQFLGRFGSACP